MADFLSAYLLNGEDELKRKFVLNKLVERASKLGDIEMNKDVFEGSKLDDDQIIVACNTVPFLSEVRLVICHNIDKAPKAISEMIIEYLQQPNDRCVLAMTASKLKKNTRLYKAIAKLGKEAVIDCAPRAKRELPAQVRDIAVSNGVFISDSAARMLIDMVGEDTVRINTELKKLRAILGYNANVGIEQVRDLVARTSEVKPWTLSDALASRNTDLICDLLSKINLSQPYSYFTFCLNTLRSLLRVKDFLNSASNREVAADIGVPDWKVQHFRNWARGYSSKELEEAIKSAAELDLKLKTGGSADVLFYQWILAVATR